MENLIRWFEIPATDIKRAIQFYKGILGVEIHEIELFGTKMGFLPNDGTNVSGAIASGDGYTPSTDGAIIYLNGGNNLDLILNKV